MALIKRILVFLLSLIFIIILFGATSSFSKKENKKVAKIKKELKQDHEKLIKKTKQRLKGKSKKSSTKKITK